MLAKEGAPGREFMVVVEGSASATSDGEEVGKVGPGHTITVTIGGKRVKTLKAGTKYRFVVSDRSEDHDFRLVGPGLSKVITSEGFVGTKTALVTLRKGTYRFFCAPHAEDMHGTFRAVA